MKTLKPRTEAPKSQKLAKYRELFGNSVDIPQSIRTYAQDNGLELRWLNAVRIKKGEVNLKHGWAPIKIEYDKMGLGHLRSLMGDSPDGFFYKGDRVLGARAIDIGDGHREDLREKAARMTKAVATQNLGAQRQFRDAARAAGARVEEGYGEDE